MSGEQKWKLAWSKLDALRSNPPSEIDDGIVQEYHEALGMLREASGEDVGPFEIPAVKLERKIIAVQRIGRSGRGGGTQYHPTKKVCDRNFFTRQLETLYAYFGFPPSGKKYGF
jgi:hypothetical protein